jgi:L-2-hydroxyglutarate oxidase
MNTADILVIGGGIVGLTTALELKRREPHTAITVLEKESVCGLHASGRNSGVLHAGFYYDRDSLKAQLVRDGNRRMSAYCEEKGLRVNACGKLVVAKSPRDAAGLDELLRRARRNEVPLHELSEREARAVDANVKTVERALYSPTTKTIDPKEVVAALTEDALRAGIELETGVRYLGNTRGTVRTSGGTYQCGYVLNAAGLYADRVARDFGFGQRYRIMPFKGLYLSLPRAVTKTHVYPVPDLKNPFLGVHLTATVDGHTKVGPTALPCLWREQYGGWANLQWGELAEISWQGLSMLATPGAGFAHLALNELRKCARASLFADARKLVHSLGSVRDAQWGIPGIRAQLVNRSTKRLEMDFVVEADGRSCHVLNAVSPAFTCAFSFADYLADRIDQCRNSAPTEVGSDCERRVNRKPQCANPRAARREGM